ncbi:molybdopterin-binding protein [Chryseobacterium fluminis]|uniref:molybdopterin-binding protein n=1 Tax=Chryseobacterium fluminis TaxID=2983606 RepID=UPI0022558223|nr:molybdopterin-binding protein [Chryseobacterium sp. MMS21-Ot14]UZT99239.1 molybdopterin-binding protein [Chryseobacterium sp. MMS21-Ot14]
MKNLTLSAAFLFTTFSFAQSAKSIGIIAPDHREITVTAADLAKYTKHKLDSVQITNHLKEYKSTLKNVNGVLLRDVLSKISFNEKSPKVLSEYYITCIAEDGYRVVFSWNEIFNTSVGDHVLIIPEVEGRPKDGISTLSPTDFATGRRYVKMLKTIVLKKAD